MTHEIKLGDEFWACVKHDETQDIPSIKKVEIKSIYGVMLGVECTDWLEWHGEITKDALHKTQEDAIEALQKVLDKRELHDVG